ncbi:hypothetical protein Mapa_018558 [Marchantia paleacea]|nr:hypothetical protein Mapa_018558 [Marchantia paleacea]
MLICTGTATWNADLPRGGSSTDFVAESSRWPTEFGLLCMSMLRAATSGSRVKHIANEEVKSCDVFVPAMITNWRSLLEI